MRLIPVAIGSLALLLAGTANAALTTVDGGLGVYDSDNHVTWTAFGDLMYYQAQTYRQGPNAFVSQVIADSFGVIHEPPNVFDPSGVHVLQLSDFNTNNGQMDWWGAEAWVNYLNVIKYGGSDHWALPTTVDSNSSGGFPNGSPGNPAESSSQMAPFFYGDLGEVPGAPISSAHNGNHSLFSLVQSYYYWSGTGYSTNPAGAWTFNSQTGFQSAASKSLDAYAWALSPGNIASVPLPAAAWFLISGLAGLLRFTRRRPRSVGAAS